MVSRKRRKTTGDHLLLTPDDKLRSFVSDLCAQCRAAGDSSTEIELDLIEEISELPDNFRQALFAAAKTLKVGFPSAP